jgi:hypothetical protein
VNALESRTGVLSLHGSVWYGLVRGGPTAVQIPEPRVISDRAPAAFEVEKIALQLRVDVSSPD